MALIDYWRQETQNIKHFIRQFNSYGVINVSIELHQQAKQSEDARCRIS